MPVTSTLPPARSESSVTPVSEDPLVLAHRASAARAQARLDAVVAVARDDVGGILEVMLPLDDARRRDWSVWFAVWSIADTAPDLAAEHRRFLAATFVDLRRVAVAARRTGRLPDDVDADGWTRRAVAALHEVAVSALLDPQSWPADRQRSVLTDLVGLPVGPPVGLAGGPTTADDLVGGAAAVLQDRDGAVRDGSDHPP